MQYHGILIFCDCRE